MDTEEDLSEPEQKFKRLLCEAYSYEVANNHVLRFNYAEDYNTEDPISVTLIKRSGRKELLTLTREELVYKHLTKNW